jgi:hypothetical protein
MNLSDQRLSLTTRLLFICCVAIRSNFKEVEYFLFRLKALQLTETVSLYYYLLPDDLTQCFEDRIVVKSDEGDKFVKYSHEAVELV